MARKYEHRKSLSGGDTVHKGDVEYLGQTLREMHDSIGRVLFRLSIGMTASELALLRGHVDVIHARSLQTMVRFDRLTELVTPSERDYTVEEKMAFLFDVEGVDPVALFEERAKKVTQERISESLLKIRKRTKSKKR